MSWEPAPAAVGLSIGHDLYSDGSDHVRLHRRFDSVRRQQTDQCRLCRRLQRLQFGHLPARDDVPWGIERRVRLELRLPMKPS